MSSALVALWILKTLFITSKCESVLDEIDMTKVNQHGPLNRLVRQVRANRTIFIVTSIMSPPFLQHRRDIAGDQTLQGNERYEGFCVDLAYELARIVKFDYEIRLVADGKYGAKTETGTWNGMVGELQRKEADLAIGPLTITSSRERVIDFSKPFLTTGISIMIKKPEKQMPGIFFFFDPFSTDIWFGILFAYLSVSSVLFLLSRFSPSDDGNEGSTKNSYNSLWLSLGTCFQQGVGIRSRSIAGGVLAGFWWFFILILGSIYIAAIPSFINVQRMLTPIESADDLAKQTEIRYGTLQSGSTKDFFQHSKIPTYEQMWDNMSKDPELFVNSTSEGVQRVRTSKGKYAFLLESHMNDYFNQRKSCNTMKVGDNLDLKGYGIATRIGLPLREPISLAVLQLLENGVLQKLYRKWWYDKGECSSDLDYSSGGQMNEGAPALILSRVVGLFYIVVFGLVLSLIIATIEHFFKARFLTHKQNNLDGIPCIAAHDSQKDVQL